MEFKTNEGTPRHDSRFRTNHDQGVKLRVTAKLRLLFNSSTSKDWLHLSFNLLLPVCLNLCQIATCTHMLEGFV